MSAPAASPSAHRTALVTGSSNGIGEALVKRLAELDFKLVVTGRNAGDIERVARDCERLSPSRLRPLEVVADFESEADVERLFAAAMAHFGRRLDLLVNNAGFALKLAEDAAPEQHYANFKKTVQINLNSTVQLTLLAAEPLKRTGQTNGRPTSVVNVSSIAGTRPLADLSYCVSKAGMNMFTSSMAAELGPHVRVNTVAPGPVETKIIERSGGSLDTFRAATELMAPLQRMGQTGDVVEAVMFLCEPERASYITGAHLVVDGGICWSKVRV